MKNQSGESGMEPAGGERHLEGSIRIIIGLPSRKGEIHESSMAHDIGATSSEKIATCLRPS